MAFTAFGLKKRPSRKFQISFAAVSDWTKSLFCRCTLYIFRHFNKVANWLCNLLDTSCSIFIVYTGCVFHIKLKLAEAVLRPSKRQSLLAHVPRITQPKIL